MYVVATSLLQRITFVRFKCIYNKENWTGMVYILLMFIATAALATDKFWIPFIPGGIQ